MKNADGSDQNIINIQEGEQEYFRNFVQKNGIKWYTEDRKNNILPLSKSYVGYIVTPVRKIDLLPKYSEIGFEHIFRIYLFVYGYKSSESPSVLDVSETQNDIDVAKLFFDSLTKNIKMGILQTYQKKEIRTKTIRGQVNLVSTYKNHLLVKRKPVDTQVSMLSLNNSYNQLITTALKKLNHVSMYSAQSSQYLLYFKEVNGNVKNGSKMLDEINFNSNTSRYRKTLQYAAMIIDQLDYDDVGNSVGTESFIINFDRLFEDFIAKVLKEIPKKREFITWESSRKFADIISGGLGQESREYLPDILFRYTDEDEEHDYSPSSYAVLDVKNKAYGLFKNADIYQILTYAKLLHSKKAILLYPSFTRKRADSLLLNPELFNPSVITGCFINIADSSGEEFLKSINFFVDNVQRVLLDLEEK